MFLSEECDPYAAIHSGKALLERRKAEYLERVRCILFVTDASIHAHRPCSRTNLGSGTKVPEVRRTGKGSERAKRA